MMKRTCRRLSHRLSAPDFVVAELGKYSVESACSWPTGGGSCGIAYCPYYQNTHGRARTAERREHRRSHADPQKQI